MPCYTITLKSGGTGILCGDLGTHCAAGNCGDVGIFLCDYPVGDSKTCDMALCENHALQVAPELHYCPAHALMWLDFKESGGVKKELENVVPFKQ